MTNISTTTLKNQITEMEQGVAATTQYSWLDLAQEILRMREEIDELLEPIQQQVDDGRELVMWCPETMLIKLTKVRNGGGNE